MHVLIIEDIRYSAIVVEKFLKSKGFHYTSVTNGLDALEALENGPSFDVVICDLFLPDMNGVSVFQECQKLKRFKRQNSVPPFILLTSSTNPQDLQKAEAAGFTATFSKPFNPTEMGEILNAIDEGQGYIQKDADKAKIIVVDSHGKNHELLQEVFASSGYRLMLAPNPANCLELLKQFKGIKAVITELEFADHMDANQMMAAIAEEPKCQGNNRPICILLTDSKNVDLVQMAYVSGFDDILSHPIDKFNLKQKINRTFLSHGKKSDELETILIVDDVFFYCTMAKNLLIKAGVDPGRYQFKIIQSGYEALDFLKTNSQVKLVLTDLVLKDLSGYELLQQYQEQVSRHRSQHNTPSFVLMTATDSSNELDIYRTKGFKEVFQKPLDVKSIHEFIKGELESVTNVD